VHVGLYLFMYLIQVIWLGYMIKGVLGTDSKQSDKSEDGGRVHEKKKKEQ
jgi:hypothetical protein